MTDAIIIALAALFVGADPIWSTPREAAAVAHIDAAALPAFDRPYAWYIWNSTRSRESAEAISYAVNLSCSRSRIIQRPAFLANNLVLRWDERLLDPPDGKRLRAVREKLLTNETRFHSVRLVRVDAPSYRAADGKTYNWRLSPVKEFALSAGVNDLLSLSTFTGSKVPIVEGHYLLSRILTTLDQGNGEGLYYEATGTDLNPKGQTDLQTWLKGMGADPNLLTSSEPQNKVAIFFSEITGKPRAVILAYGRGVRPTDATPIITLTLDIADGQTGTDRHPVLTLVGAKFQGGEGIGFLPNGMPHYVIYNAAGDFLNSVPENIARDGTIPAPYTAQLQAAIGCIRCHGADEGWRTLRNDVATLLASGLTPLDDRTQSDPITALDKILGLYTGDPSGPVQILRNSHDGLALRATGGLWLDKSASSVAAEVSRMFAVFNYTRIGPEQAIQELGYAMEPAPADADEQHAIREFSRIVPKLPALAETANAPVEDATIAALRAGIGVLRFEYERVYQDLAIRAEAAKKPAAPAVQEKPKVEEK